MAMENRIRCGWCERDDLYREYHDSIWGIPERDPIKLFEFINLEGAQAGLSWYSILVRAEAYRKAFAKWDPEKIVRFSEKDKARLMQNNNIIRNRLKIDAVIKNAKAYLDLTQKQDFSEYIWSFVEGKPIINKSNELKEIPSQTPISVTMSKDLKSKGFAFVGPVTAYAFMQATGLVDDHLLQCWKRSNS